MNGATESRFRVLTTIGQGGMAYVRLAVAKGPAGFNKLVVLKSLRDAMEDQAEVAAMFLHEARIAARLNHPHVVQTYEVAEDGGHPVIVMEYLDGQPLSEIVSRSRESGGFPRSLHLRILCDALSGLHYAHELADFNGEMLGLVHRDVSPQNVFVTYEGQVKVLDFGIAKAINATTAQTQMGELKGKIRYMAPEQMMGERMDRRADIFAVGVMLWEAISGEKLWASIPDSVVMNRVINGSFPSLQAANPDVPAELTRICLKAMSLEPEDRYATAELMQLDLEQAIGEQVKQREVAAYVADLFADTRQEMKALIETELSGHAGLMSDVPPAPERISGPMLGDDGFQPTRILPKPEALQSPEAPERTSRTRSIGLVVLAAVAAGGLLFWSKDRPAPAPAPTPSVARAEPSSGTVPTAAPSASAPAPPNDVEIRITVTPPAARLYLDDSELPSNPYTAVRPPSSGPHRLRAELTGYVPKSMEVSLAESANITLVLDPIRAVGKPLNPPVRLPPVPSSTPTVTVSAPDCTQPLFIDSQGIKRMRPECRR